MGKLGPTGLDRAAQVVSGALAGPGTSAPACFFGNFNVVLFGTAVDALTTTNGSLNASLASGTGVAPGNGVASVNVPYGTTWATFSGTSGTLALPPGYTSASILTGTDNAAVVLASVVGSVQIEKSFDGGVTWLSAGPGPYGTAGVYANFTSLAMQISEIEGGVFYRVNCTAYTSGIVNYRISLNANALAGIQ